MNRLHTTTLLLCTAGSLLATPQPQTGSAVHATVPALSGNVTVGIPSPMPTVTDKNPRASRAQMQRIPLVWRRLAWCESRWHLRATSISGKHHGLWQIHQGWFRSAGVDWRTATIDQQYRVARYVYRKQGARAWTCARKAGLR